MLEYFVPGMHEVHGNNLSCHLVKIEENEARQSPKVKSSLMVEIGPTRQSGLSKPTQPELVRPGPPSKRIFYFYHDILRLNKAFFN